MKKFLQVLAALAALCSAIAGLDLTGVVSILPQQVAGVIAVAPPIAAALFHFALALGDNLDDGQRNNSFGGKFQIAIFAAVTCLLVSSLASCASVTTVTEFPDGRRVTTTSKGIDPSAVPLVQAGAQAASGIIVRAEK